MRAPPVTTLFPYTTLFRSQAFEERHGRALESTKTPPKLFWMAHGATDIAKPQSEKVIAMLGLRLRDVRRAVRHPRSEEHTSELQSLAYLVCRLLLEKKKYL